MKVAIIGSKGQLGLALQKQYPNAIAVDADSLDITNKQAVEQFDWSGVEVLINAAAFTNVDGAETAEGRLAAWAVNADAVGNLVAVAAQKDMLLVHISTDYVFDGIQNPHTEDEPFSPLSVYGASKAAGDLLVSLTPKYYILRTSWVIGEGKNFVRTMLELAGKKISPAVVDDQVGRPTFTTEIVRAVDHVLTQAPSYGTYNVSNDGPEASWADITRQTFNIAGFVDLAVKKVTTEEYFKDKTGFAPRPPHSTLDLSKLESIGFNTRDWRDSLKAYIEGEQS